jgi:hypothetical protein
MVTVESPGDISGDDGWQGETERSKPALPRAGEKPETARAESS